MNASPNPRQVTREEARELAHLLCSDCWRPITSTFKWNPGARKNEDFISCGTPECPMHGFVSKRFVEHREQISYAEYRTAREALRHLLPFRPVTETELLVQLGVFA